MYKDPPAQHRFKKGVSGNPAGRPKILDPSMPKLMTLFFETIQKAQNKDRPAQAKLERIKEILEGRG